MADGKVQFRRLNMGGKEWLMSRMYNYDIDSDQLKPKHLRWLRIVFAQSILHGGMVRVRGQASATGSDDHNRDLARRRAERVKRELIWLNPDPWDLSKLQVGWEGAGRGSPDRPAGTPGWIAEDERSRAVEVEIELTQLGRSSLGQFITGGLFTMPAYGIWHTEWL